MLKIIFLIGATLLFHSCSDFNKEAGLKDDNPLEEAIEEMIKEETGFIVDFTPEAKAGVKK